MEKITGKSQAIHAIDAPHPNMTLPNAMAQCFDRKYNPLDGSSNVHYLLFMIFFYARGLAQW